MTINAVTAGPRWPRNELGHGRANDRSPEKNQLTSHFAGATASLEDPKRIATAQARATRLGLALEPHMGVWRLSWVGSIAGGVTQDLPSLHAAEGLIVGIEFVRSEIAALVAPKGGSHA